MVTVLAASSTVTVTLSPGRHHLPNKVTDVLGGQPAPRGVDGDGPNARAVVNVVHCDVRPADQHGGDSVSGLLQGDASATPAMGGSLVRREKVANVLVSLVLIRYGVPVMQPEYSL